MDAKPPEKPVVHKFDPEIQKKLELMRKMKKGAVVYDFGPIGFMSLGPDWKDLGTGPKHKDKFHGGGRNRIHRWSLPDNGGFLVVYSLARTNGENTAKFARELVKRTTGPVDKSDWDKLRSMFGATGNSRFFTIESIEVLELKGKKVIALTGKDVDDGSREKIIYVSLKGDWKYAHQFGIGVPADKNFDRAVAAFDKALKTISWWSRV